jgi:hypothetical protein
MVATMAARPLEKVIHMWLSRYLVMLCCLTATSAVAAEERQIWECRTGWYFDNDGSGFYRYGLVLDDDQKAWLHDFKVTDDEGLSTPLDHFYCARIV